MKRLLYLILILAGSLCAQDSRLAEEYMRNGEFEKASILFRDLAQKFPSNSAFFEKYFNCLLALKKFEESEDLLKQELKKRPKEGLLHVYYGNLLLQLNQTQKAEKQYELGASKTPTDVNGIHKLANAFQQINRFDLAIQVYETGEKISVPKAHFTYNLADLYRRKGDYQKMIRYYLEGIPQKTVQLQYVQSLIVAYFKENEYQELQSQLYEKMEANPDVLEYPELLLWSFVQLKNYPAAMRQAKALDRQLNENGNRVYQLAMTCYLDNDFLVASEGFSYLRDKGPASTFYHESYRQLLVTRRQIILEKTQQPSADLLQLENDYNQYLNQFGKNHLSAPLVVEYAELKARYLGKLSEAIVLLNELIKNPNIDPHIKAKAKLDLGDYYLITGERWEATLLYSQVDKDFKEDELGEMARFKNARLSYFAGDFQWAQEQFDILKNATSRLIANDAIDLSVFILDNLNQDSTGESLLQYAFAELKLFQNQHDSALQILSGIAFNDLEKKFLEDDVWFLEAKIYQDQNQINKALERYQWILEKHPQEIRADNALWEMARIQDLTLGNIEKAKELYEKLFIDFSNSVLAVESRKRYRQLRGDSVQ